jgi:protein phosphatase
MKIAIISDIHGNLEALSAFREAYDELWVLGDLVNYGPDPGAVIDFVKSKAVVIVGGNHDHSIGFNQDPRCSPRFRKMAEATRRYTDSVLSLEHKHFLRHLPPFVETRRGSTRFYICHALPSDPLYGYCEAESPQWVEEVEKVHADVILVGHTHIPSVRSIGSCVVVNPGSLGQPKSGSPKMCFAVWENGQVELKSCPYAVDTTVEKVQALPIESALRDELTAVLRTGSVPTAGECIEEV